MKITRVHKLIKTILVAGCILLTSCGGGGGGNGGGGGSSATAFQCTASGEGQYSISGVVSVARGSLLDSDTLATGSVVIDNGSFDSAQSIPSPVTIGGFASSPSQGADTNDFYAVELSAGASLVMEVADTFFVNDLDLYLYNSNRELLGMSISSGPIEVLIAPADGLYFVEVRVFDGQSSYVLTVDGGVRGLIDATNSLAVDFVPGEIIVQYEQVEQTAPLVSAASIGNNRLQSVAGAPGRPMRMRMKESVAASSLSSSAAVASQIRFRSEEQRGKYETLLELKRLRLDPAVKYASPNYIRQPLRVPNDPDYPIQWHYELIDLPAAWDWTVGVPEVVVAVIDTGIKSEHPELNNKIVGGYDFVSDLSNAGDGNRIDPDPDDPGASIFHGTHVAGTVAVDTDNGVGGSGVAWDASIMPLRALGLNGGTFYDIMQAMLYAAGLPNDSGTLPAKPAAVINLSLGGPMFAPDPFEQAVINQIRDQGVIIVAAAGNQSNSFPFFPASYDGVVSVSAVARPIANQVPGDLEEPMLAGYSSFGPAVDLAAPGGEGFNGVYSTWWDNKDEQGSYAFLQGTSMASPHVAGVVALMQSARIAAGMLPLTPLEFDQLMQSERLSIDLGSVGRDDQFGYGLINANLAVQAALDFDLNPPPPKLAATPSVIEFRADLDTSGITLSNLGGGDLDVTVVTEWPEVTWLDIEPSQSVDSNGLGTYLLHVDRAGLSEGDYTATIRIESSANNIDVLVNMSVSANAFAGDVGDIVVLLFGVESLSEAQKVLTVSSTNGAFEFTNIPSDCYLVAASTDIDNDFLIAEVGEAWGVYMSKFNQTPLILDSDAVNIDVEVAFDRLGALPTDNWRDYSPVERQTFGVYQ